MRLILSLILLLLLTFPLAAQEKTQFVFVGVGYSTNINGTAAYGKDISATIGVKGMFWYTAYDVTSVTRNPFHVQYSPSTGVAYCKANFGPINICTLGTLGPAISDSQMPAPSPSDSGTKVGFTTTVGFMPNIRVWRDLYVAVPLRLIDTTLSERKYQATLGIIWRQ